MSTQAAPRQKALYAIDGTHSSVEFTVRHLMISKVRGRFASVQGSLELADDAGIPQAITATIDAASLDTREEQRDAHLRSADFFDVEQYPTLAFTSTRTEGTPDNFKIYGELTIHGVTKEVVLEASLEGRGADPWGGQRVGYAAQTKISRKEFGLTWNQALEAGGVAVSDEVRIELNIQAVLQN